MKTNAFLFALIFLVSFGCGNDDESGACGGLEADLTAPAEPGPAYWVFLSDETGKLLSNRKLERGGQHTIATGDCAERYDLTILRQHEETVSVNGAPRVVTIYDIETFTGVSDGMEFDRSGKLPGALRAFTIEGVQSLELLLWPEESLEAFQRDAFLDPAAGILNFEIPVEDSRPAYLILRANGEAENRFIWVNEMNRYNLNFDYGQLGRLAPFGPVSLPNDGVWRFFIDGVGEFGSTRLDYSSLPAQVSFEFGAALPPAGAVQAFRLIVRQEQFINGALFFPIYYEKEVLGLPASIPVPNLDFGRQRTGTAVFQLNVTEGQPTAFALRLADNDINAGAGPWLRWTAYGPPEVMASFRLPEWPAELGTLRAELLDESRATPAFAEALSYDTQPSYQQFLEARAGNEQGWDARQGLESVSKGF